MQYEIAWFSICSILRKTSILEEVKMPRLSEEQRDALYNQKKEYFLHHRILGCEKELSQYVELDEEQCKEIIGIWCALPEKPTNSLERNCQDFIDSILTMENIQEAADDYAAEQLMFA